MTVISLPDIVSRYLELAPSGDVETLVGCFTDDATVVDEAQTFHGHDEIRRWRQTIASKFTYTIDVVGSEAHDPDGCDVTAKLEGNFPGSPVELKFRFTLRDGMIAGLEIAP